MRFLTLAFYVLIGALLAWFAVRNWHIVALELWGGYELAIRLPVLLFITFFLGVLPLALLQGFTRWRLRRRVRRLELELADARPAEPPPASIFATQTQSQ